ncbi:MAG TPA: hypothetical protein VMU50_17330 [Polyangia bacterium]|nr:hypothetical protein [Polyangia bacterium]
MLAVVVGAAVLSTGCNSSSDCSDGGDCTADGAVAGNDTGTVADTGSADSGLFAITPGDYCYDVLSIANVTDGCDLNVAGVVGQALLGHYDTNGTFKLGTEGALGSGPISNNMGTLTRENMPTKTDDPTCSLHQTDTTMLVLTGENQFTASVTEVEDMFAAAPACSMIPAGGSCTSTWTWTMKITATKTPPGCD